MLFSHFIFALIICLFKSSAHLFSWAICLTELQEFFILNISPLSETLFANIFSWPVWVLLSSSEALMFLILMKFILPLFLVVYALGVVRTLLSMTSQRFSPSFFSSSFTVLAFTFRSMIHPKIHFF